MKVSSLSSLPLPSPPPPPSPLLSSLFFSLPLSCCLQVSFLYYIYMYKSMRIFIFLIPYMIIGSQSADNNVSVFSFVQAEPMLEGKMLAHQHQIGTERDKEQKVNNNQHKLGTEEIQDKKGNNYQQHQQDVTESNNEYLLQSPPTAIAKTTNMPIPSSSPLFSSGSMVPFCLCFLLNSLINSCRTPT
jgi:hypothetical protein